jgi:hypothetical protein
MDTKKLLTIAMAGLAATVATDATAMGPGKGKVRCEVAMKYFNDCSANGHACGGKATKNFQKGEWLSMTQKDCDAVKKALKNPAVRKYVERVYKGAAVATKRGKKI